MNARRYIATAAMFWLAAAECALGAPAASSGVLQSACAPLLEARRTTGVPGATAAVLRSNGSIVEFALGAGAGDGVPIEPGAKFLSGSIGKTFAAALAIDLHERGIVDLDAPLKALLGTQAWFMKLPNADRVTLRQLLNHSSGWGAHVELPAFRAAISSRIQHCRDCVFTPLESVHFLENSAPLFAPGKGYSYSETGYLVAGLALEKATGRSYYSLLKERILIPLGLKETVPSDRNAIPGLVSGRIEPRTNYFGLDATATLKDRSLIYNPGLEWTGGGLAASSSDLVRWARAIYTGHALPEPYLHDLFTSVPSGVAHERYGLGVRIQGIGAAVSYGHSGSIPGYRAGLKFFPQSQIAVAVQVNDDIDSSTAFETFTKAALSAAEIERAAHPETGRPFTGIRCE